MQRYQVSLTGTTPILFHSDDVPWGDRLKEYRTKHKKEGVAGDDRSPAWTWIGSLYFDRGQVGISSDNIATMLREGGAQVTVPGGKSGKTFKAQTQSGIIIDAPLWPIVGEAGPVSAAPVQALMAVDDFAAHEEAVKALGFRLHVKRARVGTAKHVRVRPCFDTWAAAGAITVLDKQITAEILVEILRIGGEYKGLCDWRPSSKTPGQYGKFIATVEAL